MNHILVIDDEPGILDLIREALRRFGYTVDIASSGRQALQLLQDNAFDLVVTDMYMQDLDGPTIIRRIRHMERPYIPVIGMSGTPWMLEDADCDAILPKPFPLNELVEMVQQLETFTVPPLSSKDSPSLRASKAL